MRSVFIDVWYINTQQRHVSVYECGRQDNALLPQKCPHPNPRNLWIMLPLHGKRDFAGVIKLSSWDGVITLGLCVWARYNHKSLVRGKQEDRKGMPRSKSEVWKQEARVMGPWSKQRSWPQEAGKGKEMNFPLKPQIGMQPCQHLDFSLLTSRTVRQETHIVLRLQVCVVIAVLGNNTCMYVSQLHYYFILKGNLKCSCAISIFHRITSP